MSCACLAAIASAMPAILWLRRLSSRTMSPGTSVGASICSTPAFAGAGGGTETLTIDRAVEHIGHADPGRAQAGNKRGQLPVTMREGSPQPQTACTSAIAARHVRGGPGLVDEDQAVGVERRLAADEHAPGLGYVRAILLGRVQGLFLSVRLWALRNRYTVLSPTVIPEAASALRISCRLKSGCWATSCRTRAPCSRNRERRSPPIARGRTWPSARQRCAQRMALLMLISNRVAAARAPPPSAMKPITRSLRSCEYGAGILPPMTWSSRTPANQQGPENPSLCTSTRSETALIH